MENTTTIITIILAVAGLLGYVVRVGGSYLMRKNDEKDGQIKKMSEDFTNTINHQRSKDREMQEKHTNALDKLTNSIDTMVSFLKRK